jgi:ADP-ribose pyrophosphatase YjhB (NUDIX family)
MKKRGFGEGKWNGIGGKVREGETIEHVAMREIEEEIGVRVQEEHLERVADFLFHNGGDPANDFRVHVFLVRAWEGEPSESDEMLPAWFPHHNIPFESMWADDPLWLPRVLAGERLKGEFRLEEGGAGVLTHSLEHL